MGGQERKRKGCKRKPKFFGKCYIKPFGASIADTWALFKKLKPFYIVKRHALKLAYWPGSATRQVVDLDWDWIKQGGCERVGELRIHESVGGYDNLRIIFYVAPVALLDDPMTEDGQVMTRIWILQVFQKKTQTFSTRDIATFRARANLINARYYRA